jgi:hypothetical protein
MEPMKFADAETCLQLTLRALKLSVKDREFLEKAMRVYAALTAEENVRRSES